MSGLTSVWKPRKIAMFVWVVVEALVLIPSRCSAGSASQFALSIGSRLSKPRINSKRQSSGTNFLQQYIQEQETDEEDFAAVPPTLSSYRGGATTVAKTMTAAQMETLNLLAGGVAGTVASCLTNPLEVVKMQLQSSLVATNAARGHPITIAKKIMQQDGPAGFFRGLPPTLVGIIPSRSVYFYGYQRCKHALNRYCNLPEGSPPNAMISGLMAGIFGNTLTNPIWMVKTRMTLMIDASAGQKAYKGYRDVISSIYREEGIKGFYKGIQASYWGCAEGAVQFLIYEQLKTRLLKRKNEKLRAKGLPDATELSLMTYFWSAALAKMTASICTYPHEVARTRMREQARSGVFKYKGMWQSIALIAKEEGRTGLYSGMGIHLVKVVPNSALMFLTYEIVRGWLSDFTIIDEE